MMPLAQDLHQLAEDLHSHASMLHVLDEGWRALERIAELDCLVDGNPMTGGRHTMPEADCPACIARKATES